MTGFTVTCGYYNGPNIVGPGPQPPAPTTTTTTTTTTAMPMDCECSSGFDADNKICLNNRANLLELNLVALLSLKDEMGALHSQHTVDYQNLLIKFNQRGTGGNSAS